MLKIWKRVTSEKDVYLISSGVCTNCFSVDKLVFNERPCLIVKATIPVQFCFFFIYFCKLLAKLVPLLRYE